MCSSESDDINEIINNIQNIDINNTNYPIIQINGRRVYGPPLNWVGPPPPNGTELFIKNIPRHFLEHDIIPLFARFGEIYEFRLMMDYNNLNRGYGYVKFKEEEEALRAMEVMKHYIFPNKKSLSIQPSYEKCRLFVGNLPRQLDKNEIEQVFKIIFPELESIVMHNRISDDSKNRGFAFLNFPNHSSALEAKQKAAPGILRVWDHDVKVVWAYPERSTNLESTPNLCKLFFRNVDLTISANELMSYVCDYVDRAKVIKISRNREYAFVELSDHETAECIMEKMRGSIIKNHPIGIEWAIPPNEKSVHSIRKQDFDSLFRLKCIANGWEPPITIFGRIFSGDKTQDIAIIIKKQNEIYTYFFEVDLNNLNDIQSRVYEAMIEIVGHYGQLPHLNLIIKIHCDHAYIVGCIPDLRHPYPVMANNIINKFTIHFEEIVDLCAVMSFLIPYNFADLKFNYETILNNNEFFFEKIMVNDRIIGCINPNYRKKIHLKYNLEDTSILLACCDAKTKSNLYFPFKCDQIYTFSNLNGVLTNKSLIEFKEFTLLPLNFIQSKFTDTAGVYFCPTNVQVSPRNSNLDVLKPIQVADPQQGMCIPSRIPYRTSNWNPLFVNPSIYNLPY